MAQALAWLKDHPGWFLILDNVDTEEAAAAVGEVLPQLHGGDVLITSRLRHWKPGVEKLELDVLKTADAQSLFRDLLKHQSPQRLLDSEADVDSLLRELDGLAVSIEHAAAYIACVGCSIAEFRRRLRIRDEHVREWHDPAVMVYPRSVASMWDTTLEWLKAHYPESVALLRQLAWLATEAFPLWLFEGEEAEGLFLKSFHAVKQESPSPKIPHLLDRARIKLEAFSLLRIGIREGTVIRSLHPIVKEITCDQIPPEQQQDFLESMTRWINKYGPPECDDARTWARWKLLEPHAVALIDSFTNKRIQTPDVAALLEKLGELALTKHKLTEAEYFHRRAVEIETMRGLAESNAVAQNLNSLAVVIQNDPGRREEAEQLFRQSLVLMEQVFGDNHAEYGTVLCNLGNHLRFQGELTRSEEMVRQGIPLVEHGRGGYGAEHMDTLRSRAMLVGLLADKGEFVEAESLNRSLLEDRKRVLGEDHPDTLGSLDTLASYVENRGDCVIAEKLLREVWEARSKVLGSDHPDTISSLADLAGFFQRIDNCTQAELLFKQALETNERAHGIDHYLTHGSVNILAVFYARLGDDVHAEPLYRRAIEGMKKARGADHPSTLLVMGNLAALLRHKGDRTQAEQLLRKILETNERLHGSDDQRTFIALNNLAMFFANTGSEAKAEELYRHALDGLERKHGADHRDALTVVGNLAELLRQKGDNTQAEALFRRGLETNERVHGFDHLLTLNSVNTLAVFFTRTDNHLLAEPLFRKALEGKQNIQGHKHPETLLVMSNLADLLCKKGEFTEAEALLRRVLETNEREQGLNHVVALNSLENLADLLEKAGKEEESLALRDRYIERTVGKRDTSSLLSLRRLALQFYIRHDYGRAEELLRILLEKNFELPGNLCHLARLLILTGRENEARAKVMSAWEHRSEGEPYIVPRVLFLKVLFSSLDGNIPLPILAAIKHFLKPENAFCEWKIQPVLDYLKAQARLPQSSFDFLTLLARALGDRKKLSSLEAFPEWVNLKPVSLDEVNIT